jgi:hypothetical protein
VPRQLGHDAADVDQVVGNHPEADPALDSGIPLAAQPIIPIPLTSHLAGGDLPAGPRAQIRCTVVQKRLFAPESN